MHELDLTLRAQGRSEPWATETEAAIVSFIASRDPVTATILQATCGETFCRVSLSFDTFDARYDFLDVLLVGSPDCLRGERYGWNRGETFLELAIARTGHSLPKVTPPATRPDTSILDEFLVPSDQTP